MHKCKCKCKFQRYGVRNVAPWVNCQIVHFQWSKNTCGSLCIQLIPFFLKRTNNVETRNVSCFPSKQLHRMYLCACQNNLFLPVIWHQISGENCHFDTLYKIVDYSVNIHEWLWIFRISSLFMFVFLQKKILTKSKIWAMEVSQIWFIWHGMLLCSISPIIVFSDLLAIPLILQDRGEEHFTKCLEFIWTSWCLER